MPALILRCAFGIGKNTVCAKPVEVGREQPYHCRNADEESGLEADCAAYMPEVYIYLW